MIWLAALLAIGQGEAPDCARYRNGPDLAPCAFVRDSENDILDAAGRPPASALGPEAIRFSSRPELGGSAAVVEIVPGEGGGAEIRLFLLSGDPRTGWILADTERFRFAAGEYRRLARTVDAAVARYREPVPDPENGETVVCMDGPGFLLERLSGGRELSMAGQCPPEFDAIHPNREIAGAVDAALCRHRSIRIAPLMRRSCSRS